MTRRKRLRVVVLMHPSMVPPEEPNSQTEKERYQWKTEFDILTTLRELGHEVMPLGVQDELKPIARMIDEWYPDIFFNLLEEFHGQPELDHHVVSYLELKRVPYTGCRPRGLVLARDKALAKKLVAYHRIHVPHFAVFPRGRRVRKPRNLAYPIIVKGLRVEGSAGISQASIVENDEELVERVSFIHASIGADALAEEYIDGRELYVAVLGNVRLNVFPVWELTFDNLAPGTWAIATANVKHNPEYQRRRGIFQKAAQLEDALRARIVKTSRRIYKILEFDGYARIDYRLRADGSLYFLEANPNPDLAQSEEFATSAAHVGVPFDQLIQRILTLGLARG